ncbi:MAG: murein biosynthesis integral membrane protein MurJ, partial [Pseudomonadota bacterium]
MNDETNAPSETTLSAESKKNVTKANGLLRSGLLVSVMTMMSRVLGLVRDIVLAAVLGGVASGGQAGAFYVAFKVPQFLRRLFAEGAFAQAFVPVLSEYQEQKNRAQVRELIDKVNGALTLSLLCVVLLGVLGSNVLTHIVAPGFIDQPNKFAMTESLLKITFPYLLLISLAGFLGSILNSNDRFVAPAFTPIWLNVCLIAAGMFYAEFTDSPATALAYGILIAGFVQLFFLMPFVYRLGLFPRFNFDLSHPGVKRILTLMLPALLGVSVAQVNLVIDTILATNLPDGSIAWLYFSQRISDLPLGVFAIAISTVILPTLSRQFANNNESKFAPTLDWGVRFVLMIAVPSVIALCVLAQPILTSLFLYGKTTQLDIVMASHSLQAYSIGIIFFMLIKILVPGYFARQDMKTPVRIA